MFLIEIVLIQCGSSGLKNLKGNRKQKNECSCDCKQNVIAMEKIVEIPKIQVVEEEDDAAKNFQEFKLYKLANQFNSFEQDGLDKKEIKKLLEKKGIRGSIRYT